MFKKFYSTQMSAKGKTMKTRFMKMRSHKRKPRRVLGAVITVFLAAALTAVIVFAAASDGFSPVRFLNGESSETIAAVNVFNGNTGKAYTVNDKEDIGYVIENLQNAALQIDSVSAGRIGTMYNLDFIDNSGSKLGSVTINSENTLRKDPFFYTDKNASLCADYLNEIEAALEKEPPAEGAFMTVYELSDSFGIMYRYIPISDEEYERCINDTNVIPAQKPINYGGLAVYRDIEEYERFDAVKPPSQSLIELAELKAGYTVIEPDEIHDIVKADFSIKFDGEIRSETITDKDKLNELEHILSGAHKEAPGGCPYSGTMLLTRADGEEITVYFATDNCTGILLGSCIGYEIEKSEKQLIWEVFPDIKEALINYSAQ